MKYGCYLWTSLGFCQHDVSKFHIVEFSQIHLSRLDYTCVITYKVAMIHSRYDWFKTLSLGFDSSRVAYCFMGSEGNSFTWVWCGIWIFVHLEVVNIVCCSVLTKWLSLPWKYHSIIRWDIYAITNFSLGWTWCSDCWILCQNSSL